MKFFPYPVTNENLRAFCHPVPGHQYADLLVGDHDDIIAANGFVAVRSNHSADPTGVFDNPKALAAIAALPWHLFDHYPPEHKHHHRGMNKTVESWVPLDNFASTYAGYRHDPFFVDGRADLSHLVNVGHSALPVPIQILCLIAKLPRCRVLAPAVSVHRSQKFLPVIFNGGRALVGGASRNLPITSQILILPGSGSMLSGF